MFDKVLILSASAGAGHMRAADAIEKAFAEVGGAREVRHVDTLQYANKFFRFMYSRAYLKMIKKAPVVFGWMYDKFDRPWRAEGLRLAIEKFNCRRLIRMVLKEKPDLIICTHFLASELVSWLKGKGRTRAKHAIVVTDMDAHAMWLCHHYDHYFVVLEETREHMLKLGIPAHKVTVTGIPIDPVFSEEKDPDELRRKHGLKSDRTTILISAGGFGIGPIDELIMSLAELRHPAQVIAICGRSEKLKRRLDEMASKIPPDANVNFKIVGFTQEMDELMTVSDILVGKPGGLTMSEALAKGLVFVVVNPVPGQEERNSDHLLEEGVAIRCNNLPVLAYKIDRLLDDPERFATMQRNVRRLATPRAAFDVVNKVKSL